MKLTFIETPLFSRLLPQYLNDEDYRLLQQALLTEPEMGMVIPGTGGFRKLRWQDEKRLLKRAMQSELISRQKSR